MKRLRCNIILKDLESLGLDFCVGTNINFINSKASPAKRIALIKDMISVKLSTRN